MLLIDPISAPGLIKLITLILSFARLITKPIASLRNVINLPIMPATVEIALPKSSALLWLSSSPALNPSSPVKPAINAFRVGMPVLFR